MIDPNDDGLLLPRIEPSHINAVMKPEDDIKFFDERFLHDATLKKAFANDFDRAAITFVLSAGFMDEKGEELTGEYNPLACSWGYISRLVAAWSARRRFDETWKSFRDESDSKSGTGVMVFAFLGHILEATTFVNKRYIREALWRLQNEDMLCSFTDTVEGHDTPVLFYAPSLELIEHLQQHV